MRHFASFLVLIIFSIKYLSGDSPKQKTTTKNLYESKLPNSVIHFDNRSTIAHHDDIGLFHQLITLIKSYFTKKQLSEHNKNLSLKLTEKAKLYMNNYTAIKNHSEELMEGIKKRISEYQQNTKTQSFSKIEKDILFKFKESFVEYYKKKKIAEINKLISEDLSKKAEIYMKLSCKLMDESNKILSFIMSQIKKHENIKSLKQMELVKNLTESEKYTDLEPHVEKHLRSYINKLEN